MPPKVTVAKRERILRDARALLLADSDRAVIVGQDERAVARRDAFAVLKHRRKDIPARASDPAEAMADRHRRGIAALADIVDLDARDQPALAGPAIAAVDADPVVERDPPGLDDRRHSDVVDMAERIEILEARLHLDCHGVVGRVEARR